MRTCVKLLAALAASAIGGTSMALAGQVQGTVVIGPACPGPAIEGVDCPPRPIETTVDAYAVGTDGVVSAEPIATVSSDSTGHFTLNLRPGRYMFAPRTSNPMEVAKPAEVVVGDGTTTVTLQVDSGMRGPGP
jgi:hypothetical protein